MAGRIAYYGNIVTNGLVLDLDAAKRDSYPGSGTSWRDISGLQNNGTLINGSIFDSNNAGSIVFDGVDDYVNIPHNAIFNLTTAITICIWYKTSTTVDAYLTTKADDSFYLAIGPTGTTANKMSFYLNGTSGGWFQTLANAATGLWTQVTATWNGSTSNLYLNGILDNSGSRPGTMLTGTNPVYIGYRPASPKPYYSGSISQTQIYNRALSAAEVLQNYNALKGRYGL